MIITFSRNPLVKFKVWVENNIIYKICFAGCIICLVNVCSNTGTTT